MQGSKHLLAVPGPSYSDSPGRFLLKSMTFRRCYPPEGSLTCVHREDVLRYRPGCCLTTSGCARSADHRSGQRPDSRPRDEISDYSLFKEHSVPTIAGRWPTTAFPEKRLQPLTADALVIQSCTPQPPKQDCVPRIGVANNIAISSPVNRCQ